MMNTMLARLLLLVCALLFAACSSDSAGEVADGGSTTSDAAAEPSDDDADTVETEQEASSTTTEASTTTVEETTTTSTAPETTTTEAVPEQVCGVSASVSFIETAPRDSMTIINESTTEVSFSTIEFDLTTSAGDIIFDTLDGGAGVEVFQGFQTEAGEAVLAQDPVAEDGASSLSLEFDEFATGESFTFSIDVDDQLTDSDLGQIQVTGSEMAGARVVLTTGTGDEVVAIFDDADNAAFNSDC